MELPKFYTDGVTGEKASTPKTALPPQTVGDLIGMIQGVILSSASPEGSVTAIDNLIKRIDNDKACDLKSVLIPANMKPETYVIHGASGNDKMPDPAVKPLLDEIKELTFKSQYKNCVRITAFREDGQISHTMLYNSTDAVGEAVAASNFIELSRSLASGKKVDTTKVGALFVSSRDHRKDAEVLSRDIIEVLRDNGTLTVMRSKHKPTTAE